MGVPSIKAAERTQEKINNILQQVARVSGRALHLHSQKESGPLAAQIARVHMPNANYSDRQRLIEKLACFSVRQLQKYLNSLRT